MRSVGVCSLGCKVNMYESEYVINELKKAGLDKVFFKDLIKDVCISYWISWNPFRFGL